MLGGAPPARADVPAAAFVRRLGPARGALRLGDVDGRIPVLVRLPPGVDAAARGLVPVAPGLGAARLGPLDLERFAWDSPDLVATFAPPRRPLLDKSGKWTGAPAFRNATGLDGTGVVMGIVDTGIDVAHADFRNADGSTRVAWLMLREPPRGLHAEMEQQYGCTATLTPCSILAAADIDALLATPDADAVPRDPAGHGTHVASIAAGNGGLMGGGKPKYVGVAPGATMVVAAPAGAEGFSDPDILNAVRFVFDRAEVMGRSAVVNVSLGSDYGPHDGTSSLEQGLAAMVGSFYPGRALVVAAGNSGDLYTLAGRGPLGVHTEAYVPRSTPVRVPLAVAGLGQPIADGQGFVWITFRPGDVVSVGLQGPDGSEWIAPIPPGADEGYSGEDISAAVFNNVAGAAADISPRTNSAVVAWQGRWDASGTFAVLLEGQGTALLWATGAGDAAPGNSLGLLFERGLRAGTIAVPASAPSLIAVGATLNRVAWKPWEPKACGEALALAPCLLAVAPGYGGMDEPEPDSVLYFSAAGPTATGLMKPDLVAPGGLVAAAMSRDADPRTHPASVFNAPGCPTAAPCYVVDETHALHSGTSLAAPQVAGAVALLLERDPTLTQPRIAELLQAGARHPAGLVPYDYQMGPGELDLRGTLQVLEQQSGAALEPDPARSYYVLSSPYARPDPDWPVQGTVELRRADGSAAASADGAELALVVQGGTVRQRPTHVRAGLWRFEVGAPRRSGGGSVRVDVRYRGVSLGERVLPIAVDAWAATGDVQPLGGGCSVGAARGSPGPRWPLTALVLAALLARAVTSWGTRGRGTAPGSSRSSRSTSAPCLGRRRCRPRRSSSDTRT